MIHIFTKCKFLYMFDLFLQTTIPNLKELTTMQHNAEEASVQILCKYTPGLFSHSFTLNLTQQQCVCMMTFAAMKDYVHKWIIPI